MLVRYLTNLALDDILPLLLYWGRQQITGGDLRTQVCLLCNIRSWKFYNSLLEQAINDSVLMKSYDHAGRVIYALRPQAPVQTELYQDESSF